MVASLQDVREGEAGIALDRILEAFDTERWFAEMDTDGNVEDRIANVEELRSHAHAYDQLHPKGMLRGFLQDIALVSDVDSLDEAADQIKLMTLHSSKGLEFPYVFILGLEEDLLPHGRAVEEDPEFGIEEERRLLYVGMTRAQKGLHLSHAQQRRFFGDDRWQRPSCFLSEIPVSATDGAADEPQGEAAVLGEYEAEEAEYTLQVGQLVKHGHFGVGMIAQLVGSGVNARATVEFKRAGTKQLLLAYAGLEPLT